MATDTAKVLLVDDRADNLLALEAILQSLGQQLVRAESGSAALKRLLTDEFAVVLLDVQMPGMDGFETAEHIRRREKTRHTPIVFMTAGTADAHQTMRGYATGAVDYLAKPFDPWVLRAKVSFFVELYLRQAEANARIDSLSRALAMLDRDKLRADLSLAMHALDVGDLVRARSLLAALDGAVGRAE